MASSWSDWLEGEVLDHIFIDGGMAQPDTYIALFTDDPGEDASGTEVAADEYARQQETSWSRSGNAVTNQSTITFPTADESWGTITHFAIFDAVTAGNMLAYGDLDATKAVGIGDTVEFAVDSITVTLD